MSPYIPDLLILAALVCLAIAIALLIAPGWGFVTAAVGLLVLGILVGIRA